MTRPPPRSTLFPTRRSSDLDSEGGQTGTLVELNSETDFVAKNDKFVALGDEAVAAAVESGAEEPADHAETAFGEALTNAGASMGEKILEIGRASCRERV